MEALHQVGEGQSPADGRPDPRHEEGSVCLRAVPAVPVPPPRHLVRGGPVPAGVLQDTLRKRGGQPLLLICNHYYSYATIIIHIQPLLFICNYYSYATIIIHMQLLFILFICNYYYSYATIHIHMQ